MSLSVTTGRDSIKGYQMVQEIAERWSVSQGLVNQYALEGWIPGCERLGRAWVIPEDARKPARLLTGPNRIDTKMNCAIDEH